MIIRYRTGPNGERICAAPSCAAIRHVKDPDAHLTWHMDRVVARMQQAADADRRRALKRRNAAADNVPLGGYR